MDVIDPMQTDGEQVIPTRPMLGGRSSMMSNQRTIQLFSSFATDMAAPQTTFLTLDNEIASAGLLERPTKRAACERLWRIRSSGIEVLRFANVLAPLTREGIAAAGPADGLGRVLAYSMLVKVGASSGNVSFRMDIGQTFDVYGYSVDISYLGSANAGEVGSNPGPTGLRNGGISDAIVGTSINMIEAADSHDEFEYTQYGIIPSNTSLPIAVPRFARRVKVQMGLDITVAPWTKSMDVGGLVPVGPLEFNALGTVSTDESEDLGTAAFLTTDNRAPLRFATIVWTIRP